MNKIEMPMKIVDKIRQRLSDGDFVLCTWSATELIETRDALLRANERQKVVVNASNVRLLGQQPGKDGQGSTQGAQEARLPQQGQAGAVAG